MLKRKVELVVVQGDTPEETLVDYTIWELAGFRSYTAVGGDTDVEAFDVETTIAAELASLDA